MSLENLLLKGEKDFSRVQNPKFSRRSFLETGGAGLLGLLGNLVLPKIVFADNVLIEPYAYFEDGISYRVRNITETNIWQLILETNFDNYTSFNFLDPENWPVEIVGNRMYTEAQYQPLTPGGTMTFTIDFATTTNAPDNPYYGLDLSDLSVATRPESAHLFTFDRDGTKLVNKQTNKQTNIYQLIAYLHLDDETISTSQVESVLKNNTGEYINSLSIDTIISEHINLSVPNSTITQDNGKTIITFDSPIQYRELMTLTQNYSQAKDSPFRNIDLATQAAQSLVNIESNLASNQIAVFSYTPSDEITAGHAFQTTAIDVSLDLNNSKPVYALVFDLPGQAGDLEHVSIENISESDWDATIEDKTVTLSTVSNPVGCNGSLSFSLVYSQGQESPYKDVDLAVEADREQPQLTAYAFGQEELSTAALTVYAYSPRVDLMGVTTLLLGE